MFRQNNHHKINDPSSSPFFLVQKKDLMRPHPHICIRHVTLTSRSRPSIHPYIHTFTPPTSSTMKANGVISRFLLFATLFLFSSTPAEAQGYAIDYVSCSTAQQIFMEDQLLRATTIGKFVSLNLGDNLRQAQGWYLKGWIMNFVTLLMGDAQDAYVLSEAFSPSFLPASRIGVVQDARY